MIDPSPLSPSFEKRATWHKHSKWFCFVDFISFMSPFRSEVKRL